MIHSRLYGTPMRILLHIAAWAMLFGLGFYNFSKWDIPKEFIWGFYLSATISGIIFYANYILLIPKFFFKQLRLKYYLSIFLLILAMFFVTAVTSAALVQRVEQRRMTERIRQNHEDELEQGRSFKEEQENNLHRERRRFRFPYGPMGAFNFVFQSIVFTVFALGLRILERQSAIEKRQKELEKEKLNSELAFLKNQISPHFFFNTLNNIYSLIGINTSDSQDAVLKLSKMMRYLLYESEQGETKLSSEIEFMNNYIDLMKLRLTDKVRLSVSFPEEYENIAVPPLLFISVIENAFKHGISYREKSFIEINMVVSKEMITFRCTNSLIKTNNNINSNESGIGLENLKKRLSLLFPEKHDFTIQKNDSVFEVLIRIFLT